MKAVTAKEIAKALGVSERSVQKRILKESWPCLSRKGYGGAKSFELSSLPPDVRLAIARVASSEAATDGRKQALTLKLTDDLAARTAATARQYGLARAAGQEGRSRARVEARAALVVACKEYIRTSGLPLRAGRDLFAVAYSAGEIEIDAKVREIIPSVCGNSLANWSKAVETCGIAALAGKYGEHRRGSGKIDANSEISNFVRGMLTEYPHCDCKHIMRGMKARFPVELLPSKRGLQRWVAAWKVANEQLYVNISAPDRWRSRYQAAGGNASENIVHLNQRWEADSTPGDVLLSDGKRYIVVGVIDIYSRRMRLLVSPSSSSVAIAALLRWALLHWGIPEIVTMDNGSDYMSNHIQMVLLGLRITADIAPKFTPEYKPHIERGLGTFSHDIVELLPGFIGHSVAERKDIEDRRSFAARLMTKGETLELGMTPTEFQGFCDQWCENVYAHDVHSSLAGKSPWQMASEWQMPVPKVTDERALDILLSPPASGKGERDVRKKGIQLPGGWYDSPALGGHEGERVRVLLDETDAGAAYVFSLNGDGTAGEFIARVICPEIVGVSRQELAVARKAHQKKVMADARAELKRNAREVGVKDIAAEILRDRAERAGKLTRLPQQTIPHDTEALRQAGIAVEAEQPAAPTFSPPPASAEQLARAAGRAPAKVVALPDAQRTRFERWQAIDRNIKAGFEVGKDDSAFWGTYALTCEFRSMLRMEEWEKAATASK